MAPLKIGIAKHYPIIYDYSFVQTGEWLDELEQHLPILAFKEAKYLHRHLKDLLNPYGLPEIKSAAVWLMARLASLGGFKGKLSYLPREILGVAIVRYLSLEEVKSAPELAVSFPTRFAIAGLIKLAATTRTVSTAVQKNGVTVIQIDAVKMFTDAAIFLQLALGANEVLRLQHTIEILKAKLKKEKEKEKQKKSEAAKKGHKAHHDAKEKAIALYENGPYPSVLKAAAAIAPQVHCSYDTVKNWLYAHNKAKTTP